MKRDGGRYTVTIGSLEVKIRRLSHHGNAGYFLASESDRFLLLLRIVYVIKLNFELIWLYLATVAYIS